MFKNYVRLVFVPLLSMVAGVGVCWFLVTWVQHECYTRYLEDVSEIEAAP